MNEEVALSAEVAYSYNCRVIMKPELSLESRFSCTVEKFNKILRKLPLGGIRPILANRDRKITKLRTKLPAPNIKNHIKHLIFIPTVY